MPLAAQISHPGYPPPCQIVSSCLSERQLAREPQPLVSTRTPSVLRSVIAWRRRGVGS
ncbi:hypothetical protein BD410DRAFT_787157 [Rickenella mellea]|uniref:Uncharacterized protein n=1 Tax=Rickenella mellea TaxID=50990 RepID=A0A4Y7Q9G6_9AGAM|nr:hypothetical protein BD410DRAFT_797521 [Rickenella mellea]TDL23858.1 hypothetical protein BD410DRAFT_787157 [Rickenella mellea]